MRGLRSFAVFVHLIIMVSQDFGKFLCVTLILCAIDEPQGRTPLIDESN